MLDTLRTIPTPEGIELTLRVAGPVTRARAWAIDLLVRLCLLIALSIVFAALGRGVGQGMMILSWFLIEWFYPVLFEVLWNGATPGKRACRLCVLHENGTPVSWGASVTRNLLRAVDFLPFLYGFGLIAMLMNRDFKRLGDLAAGTIVVYTEGKTKALAVPVEPPSEPRVPLLLPEQRAVVDFAARRATWSDERAHELALHAAPLLANAETNAAARIVRVANYLLGRR